MGKNYSILCNKDITNPVRRVSPNALPCGKCGSTKRKLGVGKRPHTASLKCAECDRFIKWVGKSELVKIENQGGLR
jgi:hypothetical protein